VLGCDCARIHHPTTKEARAMEKPRIPIPEPFPEQLLICAIFTLAIHQQRVFFVTNQGREPTDQEMEPIRYGVFNEWVRTAAQFANWLRDGLRG
jgi:hypothetical protein